MSQKNFLLVVLAVILLSGAAAIFYAQTQTQNVPVETATKAGGKGGNGRQENVVGENVSFTITEAERKKWEIRAKQATYFKDQSGAQLVGVEGEFFNDKGKKIANFTSPTGEFHQKENKIVLTGGVVAQSVDKDGVSLKAPKMTWSSKADKVVAEQGVHLTRKGFGESTAEVCRFSLDFTVISLEGNAQSRVNL